MIHFLYDARPTTCNATKVFLLDILSTKIINSHLRAELVDEKMELRKGAEREEQPFPVALVKNNLMDKEFKHIMTKAHELKAAQQ